MRENHDTYKKKDKWGLPAKHSMIDNSRICFHGNVIFGNQGQMTLSSNKLWNGTCDPGETALDLFQKDNFALKCQTRQPIIFMWREQFHVFP